MVTFKNIPSQTSSWSLEVALVSLSTWWRNFPSQASQMSTRPTLSGHNSSTPLSTSFQKVWPHPRATWSISSPFSPLPPQGNHWMTLLSHWRKGVPITPCSWILLCCLTWVAAWLCQRTREHHFGVQISPKCECVCSRFTSQGLANEP